MSDTLPSLGRKGLTTVRRISGIDNPGWNTVDPDAAIIAGMVAARTTDADGNNILTVCNASAIPVGIFYLHKNLNFYVPVIGEAHTMASAVTLDNANVTNVSVVNASTGVAYTVITNFTVSAVNGIITNMNIPNGTHVKVNYLYKDPNTSGVDQTVPTGLISILEGEGQIGTLIYDTSAVFAINDLLHCNADGYLSTASGLSGKVVGIVTQAPTANDQELIFKLSIQL